MKNSRHQESKQSKQGMTNKPRPEIRDDMDSRHNKENRYKVDEVKDKSEKVKKPK